MKSFWLFLIGSFCFISCSQSKLEQALGFAGENRAELEKVLAHYSESQQDYLKLKAAEYLIENMIGKYSESLSPVSAYNTVIDELSVLAHDGMKDPEKQIEKLWISHPDLLEKNKYYDLHYIKSDYLIKNIEQAFDAWSKPWSTQINFDQFCEEILPYRIYNEPLEDWRDSVLVRYKNLNDSLLSLSNIDVFEACKIIYDNIDRRWGAHVSVDRYPEMSYSMINKTRVGTCKEKAFIGIYIMRALGIPTTIENIRTWADRNGGHMWNTLRIGDKMVSFTITDARPDGSYLKNRIFAKVYQHSWKQYDNIFGSKDVTEKYTNTQDIILEVDNSDVKTVYLYNSNRLSWTPVCSGRVKGKKVYFEKLGVNVVYLPSYDNQIFGYPFILHKNGEIQHLIPNETELIEMSLFRTFPLFNNKSVRMKGGQFEGSNNPDFKNAELLYHIDDAPELSFHEIEIQANQPYRYVRYLSPLNSYGNIAELEFYKKDVQIKGKIIGTKGYYPWDYGSNPLPTIDAVFDGDEFTYFDASGPDSAWVGLDFGKPMLIDKIRYLPKIDNNVIKPFDIYELYYCDGKNNWISLGAQTASDKKMVFINVPSNALYLLDNSQRGSRRIFTYENGKQIWW